MSKTIEGLPKERMIETPVMEETQMGMTVGLAMTGHQVISFYPRWDFVILAAGKTGGILENKNKPLSLILNKLN